MSKYLLPLLLIPSVAAACKISWDVPADTGWLEGIRFYRDGVAIGTATIVPPVDCAAVGVEPCATCVYTARFFRGDQEGPDSAPLAVAVEESPAIGCDSFWNDPVPLTDLGFDLDSQIDACDYDAGSRLSATQCPRRQAIRGVGAYLQFDALDLRGAECVQVYMPNEARRGITVLVDGLQVARLPSSGLVDAAIAPLTCDTCTVQLYQDGSFGNSFVWLYWFEFLQSCP